MLRPPKRRTGLVFDKQYVQHDPGPGHPESPQRYLALHTAFERANLLDHAAHIAPRIASDDDLHLCHTNAYINTVRHDIARRAASLSTGDTAICPRTLEAARLAAGGALSAVDAVMQDKVQNAFVMARPPGHHATASRGMGFCVFNTVAIAARYAQRAYGVRNVLIADWDVHHGNGTQDIFYEDPSVFFFSTHQAPWYPGTGAASETGQGAGKGATLNCPFRAGAGRSEILSAFRIKLLPWMKLYKPELVILSAGFDSRRGDPLGRLNLRDEDFSELTEVALEIADTHAGGRVVSVLEGGYDIKGLAAASLTHVQALMGA